MDTQLSNCITICWRKYILCNTSWGGTAAANCCSIPCYTMPYRAKPCMLCTKPHTHGPGLISAAAGPGSTLPVDVRHSTEPSARLDSHFSFNFRLHSASFVFRFRSALSASPATVTTSCTAPTSAHKRQTTKERIPREPDRRNPPRTNRPTNQPRRRKRLQER